MRDIIADIDSWLSRGGAAERDPVPGMAEAGLLAPIDSYGEIARGKAALVERTGLLGLGGVWAGQQMVGRHFVAGFGTGAQRAAWLGRAASVAISEPNVGAHPKRLTTRAEPQADGWRISGEKAWVSNGPSAEVFVVLAISAMEGERKRYSAFLVPRDAPGLSLSDMPRFHALRPSLHCLLRLEQVCVPHAALLGEPGRAYETMALPFRDVEDAVGAYGLLGAFRWLARALSLPGLAEDAALSLGGIVALAAVFADAAEALLAALDAGRLADKAATLAGLRLLAADLAQRARLHLETPAMPRDAAIEEMLGDIGATLSIARGPRQARLRMLVEATAGRTA